MAIQKIKGLFRGIILAMWLLGVLFLIILGPKISYYMELGYFSTWIQVLLWLTAIPYMYILTVLWQLSNHLVSETVFSKENIKRLSKIAYAGLIESGIYTVAFLLGLIFLTANYPFLMICLFFFFVGIVLAVLSALLAYIFKLANRLKDEKDI